MLEISRELKICSLFKDFHEEEISSMLKGTNYIVRTYTKGETIAFEGDKISSIGIILSGNIEVQKSYPSGKIVVVNKINEGGIFGEVIIYSNKKTYPSTIVAIANSRILFISEEDVSKLCSNYNSFLTRFMGLLSNKILMLSGRLKNLSYQTIREKLANYILEEYNKQKNYTITIKISRQEMSEQFGTTRPSLSRELMNMRDEGIIDYDKKVIIIKNIDALEDCLF